MKYLMMIVVLFLVCVGCEQTPLKSEVANIEGNSKEPRLLLNTYWYGTVYWLDDQHPATNTFVEIIQWRLDTPHGGTWDYTFNPTYASYTSQEFGPQHMGIYAHGKITDTKGETHRWSQAYDHWFWGGPYQKNLICNQTREPMKYYDPDE